MNMKPLTQYLYDEGLATYKVATVRVYGTCCAYKNLMTGEIKLLMLDTLQVALNPFTLTSLVFGSIAP